MLSLLYLVRTGSVQKPRPGDLTALMSLFAAKGIWQRQKQKQFLVMNMSEIRFACCGMQRSCLALPPFTATRRL